MPGSAPPTPVPQLRDYSRREILRAADINGLIWHAKGQLLNELEGDIRSPGFVSTRGRVKTVLCQNDFAGTCPWGACVKPGNVLTVSGHTGFHTTRPDGTYVWKYLINIQGDVPQGAYYWAAWLFDGEGDGHALLSVNNDTSLEWGPTKDQWYLSPKRPGFIFQALTDSARKFGEVVQRIPPVILGHAIYPIAHGSSDAVMVYGGASGSEASLGYSIPSCRNKGPDIAADQECTVSLVNGQPYCSLLDCGS